jgi:hypothetical protein
MTTDFFNSSTILATVTSILEAEGLTPAATVLKTADARFEKMEYDNWNGGTDLYTLFLQIDAGSLARLGQACDELEQQITERLKPVIDGFSDDWVSAQVRPRVENRAGWKSMGQGGLTTITRRDIRNYFMVSEFSWRGDLDETEFLSRLYDQVTLPPMITGLRMQPAACGHGDQFLRRHGGNASRVADFPAAAVWCNCQHLPHRAGRRRDAPHADH